MAKNNKGKVIQLLSPENYIRKKVRTLPIFECLVRSEWKEAEMTTVLVARKHTNGNITVCTYLVDLLCLGVKDSMFLFNVPVSKYEEFKNKVNGEMEMTEVDYTLAHNIVHAGIEFAEEFGFMPHKDYESVTKFMLEEDTEDIDLIEIECGRYGKPIYIRGPFEDDAKARRIVAQLEKTAGPGNYAFVDMHDEFDNEYEFEYQDEDEFENDDDIENEFGKLAFEEKKKLFFTLTEKINDQDEDEGKRFIILSNSLVDDLIDQDRYNQFYDEYTDELSLEIEEYEVPDQLLGIRPGNQIISEKLKSRFMHIYQLIDEDPKFAKKELKLFQKEADNIPGVYFLELLLNQTEGSSKYGKRLKEYAQAYPDYPLIQLLWNIEQVTSRKDQHKLPRYPFKLKSFFPDRQTIHPIERFYTLLLFAFATGIEMDINRIEAFSSVIYEFDLLEIEESLLITTISFLKISYLLTHL